MSSKAIDKVKDFNLIIESFLQQMAEKIGTTYYTYFCRVTKVNALIAIENAIHFLIPSKDKIFNQDESYFQNEKNYMEHLSKTTITHKVSKDVILSEIFRLKDIYETLDENSKIEVWAILQALVQLTIEYCEIKGIKID
jgi:hypothetical protein